MPKVNREQLLLTLQSVEPGLSTRPIIEQSTHFAFLDGRVYTFDDEVACHAPSPLGDAVTGAVKSKPLLDLLQKLPEEEVTVEADGSELVITGRRRRAGIGMEAEVTLAVNAVEQPKRWSKLPDDFAEAVGVVSQCASSDQSRFEATCVHVHPKWLEACDEYHLCRWRLETGLESSTLVRRTSIEHITKLGMSELAATKAWLHFRNPHDLVLSCRRYLEEYADLAPYLKFRGTPVQFPKGLVEACDKAEIFSAENAENNLVTVKIRQGKLTIEGRGVSGWYTESKKVNYAGDELEFLIPPKLLAALVKRHNEVEVTPDKLRVRSQSYTYVSCLSPVGNGTITEEDAETQED